MKKGLLAILLILVLSLTAFIGCTYTPADLSDIGDGDTDDEEYVVGLEVQNFTSALEAYEFGEDFFATKAEFYESTQRGIAYAMSFNTYVLTKRFKSDVTNNFLYETNTYSGLSMDPSFGLKSYRKDGEDTIYYKRVNKRYNASSNPNGTKKDDTYSSGAFQGSSSDFTGLTVDTKANWNEYKTDVAGNLPQELTVYKVDATTVTSDVFTKNADGSYSIVFTLNSGSIVDYQNQVEKYSENPWTAFSSLKLSIEMDKYGRVGRIEVDELYSVRGGTMVKNDSIEIISYGKRPEINFLDDSNKIKNAFITYAELPEASEEQYTISFDSQGGEQCDDIVVNHNTAVGELPTPSHDNDRAVFMGWFTEPSGRGDKYVATTEYTLKDDLVLYAFWRITADDGGIYKLNAEETEYELEKINSSFSGTFIVAEYFNDLPVTAIGSNVLKYTDTETGSEVMNTKVKTIILGDNVEVIGVEAFKESSIESFITRNTSNLKRIEQDAFRLNKSLLYFNLPEGLEYIGVSAFYQCGRLTSLMFPSSLTKIDETAFYYCAALKADFADVNSAQLTEIAKGAFQYANIQFVKMPNSVDTLGESAFHQGTTSLPMLSLAMFELSTNLIEIPKNAFNSFKDTEGNGLLISFGENSKVTTIGENAFQRADIMAIKLHEGIESIGANAFAECAKLEGSEYIYTNHPTLGLMPTGIADLVIPASVETIGNSAFSKATALKFVEFADGSKLTAINTSAFSGSGLKKITLSEGIKSIAANAFSSCASLTTIIINSTEVPALANVNAFNSTNANLKIYVPQELLATYQTATNWSNATVKAKLVGFIVEDEIMYSADKTIVIETFDDITGEITLDSAVEFVNNYSFRNRENVISVILDDSVATIGEGAFMGCVGITTITMSDNVTTIGEGAFMGCANITTIALSQSITEIGVGMFMGCASITTITLPQGITKIGAGAFKNCSSLSTITIEATAVPVLENADFIEGTSSVKIYAPIDSIIAYSTAEIWNVAGANGVRDKLFAIENGIVYNYNLTSVTATLETIAGEVTIRDTVTAISASAFQNRTNVTVVRTGNALATINANAFNGCSSLESLIITNTTRVVILSNVNALAGTHANLKITVPSDRLNSYKTANNWKAATVVDKLIAAE